MSEAQKTQAKVPLRVSKSRFDFGHLVGEPMGIRDWVTERVAA
jgi:hypothetical protein